jgi:hypothetical protein
MKLTLVLLLTTQPNKRKFSSAKFGKRAGRLFISKTSPNGFRTTISFTRDTVRHSHPSVPVLNQSSDCIRKPETSGEWTRKLNLRRNHNEILRRTHLLGCIMFIGTALYFLIRPSWEVNFEEKMIFSAFFIGAILCLGFSFTFHTVSCHSEVVGKLFSK